MSRHSLEPHPRIALDPEGELSSETLLGEAGAYALTRAARKLHELLAPKS